MATVQQIVEVASMKLATVIVVTFLALVAWGASTSAVSDDGRSVSKVNGSVRATAGETYDKVSAVNGNVHIERGATVDEAETVNGEVVIEDDAKVGTVSTVNGSLEIGERATVSRGASTVNGYVKLATRARVGGDVSSVSGYLELRGADVGGKLITSNGDIELTDGAHVRGGIHIRKNKGSNWGWGREEKPEVHICSTCVVEGELRFDRPVELRVDQGGKIGTVIGEEVERR